MTKLHYGVALSALFASALPASALAVPAPDETTNTERLVVTGTRAPAPVPADQLGASLTVIDNEALTQRQTREIADILRDVPGLAVSGVAGQVQVRIRGTEANHTLVLIDLDPPCMQYSLPV